jgi:hypothetical protein
MSDVKWRLSQRTQHMYETMTKRNCRTAPNFTLALDLHKETNYIIKIDAIAPTLNMRLILNISVFKCCNFQPFYIRLKNFNGV